MCASKISIKLLCSLYFLVVQWEGTGMRWVKVEGCEPMDFWKIVFMFVGGCECGCLLVGEFWVVICAL